MLILLNTSTQTLHDLRDGIVKVSGSEYSLDPILLMALTLTLALSPSGRSSDIRLYVTTIKLLADKLTLITSSTLKGPHHYDKLGRCKQHRGASLNVI